MARKQEQDVVDLLVEQHEMIRSLRLAELYDLGVDHPQFNAKPDTLANAVLKHAESEGEIEFPGLREKISPEELVKLVGS